MSEHIWHIDPNVNGGKPTNAFLPDVSEISDKLSKPYPKNMWRIKQGVNGGKPTNAFLPDISEIPEKMSKPYPKNMWRIKRGVNGGKPYNYFLPVSEIPPPPSKWKFAYSDSKKALFSVEKDMRFGIEISDYKFSFSVSE